MRRSVLAVWLAGMYGVVCVMKGSESMMSRLTQIKMMLRNALDDGVMRESSDLSDTLKKFSGSYSKKGSNLITVKKQGDITEHTIISDKKDVVDDRIPGIHSRVIVNHVKKRSDNERSFSDVDSTDRSYRRREIESVSEDTLSDYSPRRRDSSKYRKREIEPVAEPYESEYDVPRKKESRKRKGRKSRETESRRETEKKEVRDPDEFLSDYVSEYVTDSNGYVPERYANSSDRYVKGGHKYGRKSKQKKHRYDTSYGDD